MQRVQSCTFSGRKVCFSRLSTLLAGGAPNPPIKACRRGFIKRAISRSLEGPANVSYLTLAWAGESEILPLLLEPCFTG
jgi:hypothetical protein